MIPQTLTRNLTTYDFLKAAAVLLMVVDHIGYYFFPDEMWFRVAGRMCVPIWFFLVGYARSRDLSAPIWIGMGVLVVANVVSGQPVFPLNVLATIILVRFALGPVMARASLGLEPLVGVCLALALLSLPSYFLTEYGVHGILMAMFGYVVRNRPEIPDIKNPAWLVGGFFLFNVLAFIILQQVTFAFDRPQFMAMCAGIFVVNVVLLGFRPVELPRLGNVLPGFVSSSIRFLGRRTMEIYVVHLVAFKAAGMIMAPERFQPFHWILIWGQGG